MHTELDEHTILVDGEVKTEMREVRRVYEQRWSALLHAAGVMLCVSSPCMHVLGLTPTSALAALFKFMGEQGLGVNPILYRKFYFLTPPSELPTCHHQYHSTILQLGELTLPSTVTRLFKF